MLSEKAEAALNRQTVRELYAARAGRRRLRVMTMIDAHPVLRALVAGRFAWGLTARPWSASPR